MSADVESIVVGAGAVGLAIGRALALKGQEVMVLERHDIIGSETSSRNSEVIHAGLYYPPGSLRALLCVKGKHMLYPFCAENGVPHRRIGKLLVATSEAQLPKLQAIKETAERNGVHDLEHLSAAESRKLEPELHCTAALLSPSTGIIDSHSFMQALEGHIDANGGQVVLNTPVEAIHRGGNGLYHLATGGDAPAEITCRNLIISAGLEASRVARMLAYGDAYTPPETYYAKGQYYALTGRSPFSRHIYPMPDGAWLGLHVTVDIGGRCKFGPDIEWIPGIDYSFDPGKLDKFLEFIRSYYPGLDATRLHGDYTGIRPKLYREGEPVPDFRIDGPEIHGLPGLVSLFGIESPGLTASLAIGDLVSEKLG
jgi:L-2-hydroxyglutarate oxidase LhgO